MRRASDYSELWDELETRLTETVDRLEGILTPREKHDARDFVSHNEFGVAWHTIAHALIDRARPITGEHYQGFATSPC